MLFRKKIILGVTGSIAAYKSALLARLLIKSGADVRVVMTESSKDFITPLTLSTLTKNSVFSSFITGDQGEWVNHVELGLWADAMVIAPASANTISHFANGICHGLLDAVYLSSRAPVFLAPAMDLDMWKHGSTRHNIHQLKNYGNIIIEPGKGELASGLVGEGRMAEPEEILEVIEQYFTRSRQMNGKKILVTAGPTRENIDAVRFVSNHSSGLMGYALSEELASRGAKVKLISGPVGLTSKHPNIELIKVNTAAEMYKAANQEFPEMNAAILTAAVADFKPVNPSAGKIKKTENSIQIKLEQTPDILKSLGTIKTEGQILAGFALETDNGRSNAEAKLKNKNLDFIVLNQPSDENPIFGSEQNQVDIYTAGGEWKSFPMQSKEKISVEIADLLHQIMKND